MERFQENFIEFMVRSGVLTFGDFTTKSGRKTPYFVNTGNYKMGSQARELGRYYSQAVNFSFAENFDVLFGPSYKGIPLVVATSILNITYNYDVPYCFNRKEVKDHGEGGGIIGHQPLDGDKFLIIEDVTTSGSSIRESIALLKKYAEVAFTGVIISVDRQEKGKGEKSAIQEVKEDLGIPIIPIVTLDDIVEHLHNRQIDEKVYIDDNMKVKISEYREEYGAKK